MAISAEEYLQKSKALDGEQIKTVKLSCGEFEIKKIKVREMKVIAGRLGLMDSTSLKVDNAITVNKDNVDFLYEGNKRLICLSVVSPQVYFEEEKKENAIHIDDLLDEDYEELLKEIVAFSIPRRQDLKSFRNGSKPSNNPRPPSKKILKKTK